MLSSQKEFVSVPTPGLGGWNNFTEADAIEDTETPEIQNMVYDGGYVSPRRGSTLFAAKPTGESGNPLQLIRTQTSDGVQYLLAIYDSGSIWLYHPDTSEWLKINQTFTPTYPTLLHGYETWNNGRGDDRLYAGNGRDSNWRWDLCVSTASGAHAAGATTLTLADASRFPSSGTVVIEGDSSTFTEAYTSKAGNVLTLTNTLNQAVSSGAMVATDVTEKASMTKGKVFRKHGSRLVILNRYGAETAGTYSVLNSPEDFTAAATIAAAATFVIADGNGEIINAHDFGEYLLIEKEDSHHQFSISVSDDLASKLDRIKPIMSSSSIGPRAQHTVVKVGNRLLYPTRTEGFSGLDPTATGNTSSTGYEVISRQIQSYVVDYLSYTNCRGGVYRNKALWAVGILGGTENTIVLMYDTIRKAWSKLSGWAVKDFANYNDELYFLENGTGKVYKAFTRGYHDENNPYQTVLYTKRFNFGQAAQPKRATLAYIQGYMTPASDIFVDVLFNEAGVLDSQTFRIKRDSTGLLFSQPLTNTQGQIMLGTVSLGYVELGEVGDVSIFRCYLGIKGGNHFHNIQMRIYSNASAFYAVTAVGFNPELVQAVGTNMTLSPTNT